MALLYAIDLDRLEARSGRNQKVGAVAGPCGSLRTPIRLSHQRALGQEVPKCRLRYGAACCSGLGCQDSTCLYQGFDLLSGEAVFPEDFVRVFAE